MAQPEKDPSTVEKRSDRFKALAEEGLWSRNPALVGLLGLCPLLAVSTNFVNALALGVATTAVLWASSGLISLLKHRIADTVRLPLFMIVLASMVTIADFVMEALIPDIHRVIGLFIPLIVTNCAILGRIEAFAYRQSVSLSLADGLFMGLGFTWVICLLGGIREILGTGGLFEHADQLFGEAARNWTIHFLEDYVGFQVALLPAGAFLLLGLLLALKNWLTASRSSKSSTMTLNQK
jgi:electron transport complex protein RnfE